MEIDRALSHLSNRASRCGASQNENRAESVAFMNGFLTRDFTGSLWLWKNLFSINRVTTQAEGCVQVKAGICSPTEVMMVSYWRSEHSLKEFFRSKWHQQMMQFAIENPHSLCLYNEIYQPSYVGKYIHEPQGMATIYPRSTKGYFQSK